MEEHDRGGCGVAVGGGGGVVETNGTDCLMGEYMNKYVACLIGWYGADSIH